MALAYSDVNVPLASGHPLPATQMTYGYDADNYHYKARVYYDDGWSGGSSSTNDMVLYFHGSGASEPLDSGTVTDIVNSGKFFVAVMALGVWQSSPSPYRYGYGNVNAPQFMAHFIKDAWWVRSGVDYFASNYASNKKVIFGHSKGATASLTWGAGYANNLSPSGVTGILANGATVAGLGNLTWNDVNRNINTLSGIVHLLKIKTIMTYGDSDKYAPPDYARRLQMAIPEGADTYMLSPGDFEHQWANDGANSAIVIAWLEQLLTGAAIQTVSGGQAKAGPVA